MGTCVNRSLVSQLRKSRVLWSSFIAAMCFFVILELILMSKHCLMASPVFLTFTIRSVAVKLYNYAFNIVWELASTFWGHFQKYYQSHFHQYCFLLKRSEKFVFLFRCQLLKSYLSENCCLVHNFQPISHKRCPFTNCEYYMYFPLNDNKTLTISHMKFTYVARSLECRRCRFVCNFKL